MYVIYHSRDLDGQTAGAICLKRYPDAIAIGYDYGQPFPFDQIEPNQPIIMVDVSLPMTDMARLGMHSNNQFTWIDHHISAITDYLEFKKQKTALGSFIKPIYDVTISACEIAWKYFFGEEMPIAVRLLGMYDTFRKENESYWENYVLPFQYGMRCKPIDSAQSFPQELLSSDDQELMIVVIPNIIHQGKIALDYQRNIDRANMLNSFEADFEGLRAICCNGSGFGSMAFDSVWNPNQHDIMIPYKHNGEFWTISLYSPKYEVDCSVLAKKYYGGGHKGAAGFTVNGLPDFLIQ